jgi:hypothetical protein
MGAWGTGPFENDDAADWCYELVDGGGPDVVAAALRAVQGGSAPNAPADSSAVGAAAVVAAGLGVADVELPDDVSERLAGIDASAWPPLARDAVAALDRVLAESELRDLWDEVGDSVWPEETRALRDRIDAAAR